MLEVALRHRFAGFSLDAAFRAPEGATVLFGPSGSGKSTVLNGVAGLLRPSGGRVAVGGAVLTDTARGVFLPVHRRRLGVVFQDGRLFPHLTVRQNLRYGQWFAGGREARFSEAAVVGILGLGRLLDRTPSALSGGERQRVAIGRALMAAPRLILADEPLSALDEALKAEILPCLEQLRDEWRVPMLYVSHSAAEVARIATTIVVMDRGRVVRAGPAAEILADPALAGPGREAGALIEARVVAHHADGVTELLAGAAPPLGTEAGTVARTEPGPGTGTGTGTGPATGPAGENAAAGAALFLPALAARPGQRLRLRIAAADVMLARGVPQALSALNVLPGIVDSVTSEGASVLVRLNTPAGPLLSRVTRRSAEQLGIAPGEALTAIIKSVAQDPVGTLAPGASAGGGRA